MRLLIPKDDLFGLHNLPYGVASTKRRDDRTETSTAQPQCVVRYGDHVVDLALLLDDPDTFARPSLNRFMAQGHARWQAVRDVVASALIRDVPDTAVHAIDDVDLHLPFEIADYVDFYASEHHAANLGRLFRPDDPDPLTPNWKHLPIGYHGRSSSIVVSGTGIVRPNGQRKTADDPAPTFGPSTRLDIEAEVGFVVGTGNPLGVPIDVAKAEQHLFGAVLFNDWSARDIQAWEYVPLGPNLGKSFASTISPWVVPMAALQAAKVSTPPQEPPVLPYLDLDRPWGLDIDLEVVWNGEVVSRPPYAAMHWSPAQMLAHLTVNGARTRTGDLFASGTVSGPDRDQRGAFIELSWGGRDPIRVAEHWRTFLEDGDEVVLRATAPASDGRRLGLGEARGRILPAPTI